MGTSIKDIIAGRKTFFICPDTSLIPETFMEEYLSEGYECYFVTNDKRLSLQEKIEIIISVFNDVILFFNIDANIPGISWPSMIKAINDKYQGRVLIGALYTKRQTKEEKQKIEKMFLYDIGITCGCIQLEYQKKINFGIIEKVLFANQAMGRRKNVRALCNNSCTFTFTYNNHHYSSTLNDISLSHFSSTFDVDALKLPEYEKIEDIQFTVKGLHFRSSAVLFMSRQNEGKMLYVFTFVSKTGASGLDLMTKQLLIPRLYQIMDENASALLNQLYNTYIQRAGATSANELGESIEAIDVEDL